MRPKARPGGSLPPDVSLSCPRPEPAKSRVAAVSVAASPAVCSLQYRLA